MLTDRIGDHTERTIHVADGERIVAQGDAGTEMFVVSRGRVRVSLVRDGQRIELGHVERGGFFGEMSVLEGMPRLADVHADGDVTLLVLGAGSLLARMRRDPSLAIELLHHLSGRIRALTDRLPDPGGPAA